MNFIYIWHDGRYRFKVLLRAIPTPGLDLQGCRLRIFIQKSNFLHQSLHSYVIKTLWLISLIFRMMIYIDLKFFLHAIPKLEHSFEVKVTDLEFSYKCQSFCLYYKDWLISLVFIIVIIAIGLAQFLHQCLTFRTRSWASRNVWLNSFNVVLTYM